MAKRCARGTFLVRKLGVPGHGREHARSHQGVRAKQPARIVVAVPAAAPETCESLESEVGEIVCAETPEPFYRVGRWYQDFSQTTDEEVRMYLEQTAQELKY